MVIIIIITIIIIIITCKPHVGTAVPYHQRTPNISQEIIVLSWSRNHRSCVRPTAREKDALGMGKYGQLL